jgi:hypothetical protein
MHADKMKDVYVTDHVPKTKKYFTNSEEEDIEFYNYMKSLESYNATPNVKKAAPSYSSKYERGSFLQRMLDPLAGSTRLENGTIFLEIVDKDIEHSLDEDRMRQRFDMLKNDEVADEEDGSEELQISLKRQGDDIDRVEMDALREKMENEFASFLKGEKYDYVKDMRKAYSAELATPLS